jgi:multiple antibiotic resistance protein
MTHWELALLSFTSLITLINPFGVMPVFMTMTATLDDEARRMTAIRANVVAFLILIAFALAGEFIFKFFGISVDAFRIVGGIIFFMVGQDMLQARIARTRIPNKKVKQYVGDISVTPLGIPMITGPGAITYAIVMMQTADTPSMKLTLVGVIGLVITLNAIGLLFAGRITEKLGETGNNVLMRLMGLIVMVIAVELFFSGLGPIVQRILQIGG